MENSNTEKKSIENLKWEKYLKIPTFKNPNMDVIVDEKRVDEILTRGVKEIFPGREQLKTLMMSGARLRLYTGIDPTANFLHMGHFIWMRKLAQFQKLGHQVIFMIGGFTAMVGDPDKKSAREPLSKEQVQLNFQTYEKTANKLLNFNWEKNPISLLNNYDWLSTITLEDWLLIMSKVTMQHMLSHDMFKKRLSEELPIRLHEISYPLMQGFDCVAMNVDLEVGGSDQTFNMLTGRILSRELIQKEKLVMTLKLLTDNSGNKMGKTTGNAISSNDSNIDMFGKIMSWNDDMIFQGFEQLTDESLTEITEEKISKDPMNYKKLLAEKIVEIIKSEEESKEARQSFEQTVQGKGVPDDIQKVQKTDLIVKNGNNNMINVKNLVTMLEMIVSGAEAKRIIAGGGVMIDEKKYFDPNEEIDLNMIKLVKAGKRNWREII